MTGEGHGAIGTWSSAAALRFARDQIAPDQPILSSWTALIDYCRSAMAYEDIEQFRVLFLDKRNRLICRFHLPWTFSCLNVFRSELNTR